MKEFEACIKELKISKDTKVVVAVSGGPDSMVLLSLLELQFKNIICVHVNHNTGRVGQEEDEAFVKEYCMRHGHILESMKIEQYGKENFHDKAHQIRYQFFENILNKYHSNYLFTAHHGDDLMETMLFRLIRGSLIESFHGFSKIKKKNNYFLVRPLLNYSKKDLLDYSEAHQISYRVDPSNEKDIYTRNRIRKYVLPPLKQENQNIHLKFLNLSEELEEVERYLEKQVENEFKLRFQENVLSLKNWNNLDIVIQKRLLQKVLVVFYNKDQNKLKKEHVKSLLYLISDANSGSKVNLPSGLFVRKEYDFLLFFKEKKECFYEIELTVGVKLPNGHEIKFLENEELDNNFVCRLSKEDVIFPLIVRSRRPQDRMCVKGLQGSKKIKEIFINEKIPVHLRQDYPIVTDKNGKIVWIPGVKKSKFDKTKEEKYDIILRYY